MKQNCNLVVRVPSVYFNYTHLTTYLGSGESMKKSEKTLKIIYLKVKNAINLKLLIPVREEKYM